ncbi:MAG: sigma factor-like helix-turn-helix DNA-binding protein, partial [Cetobacterium sp.]
MNRIFLRELKGFLALLTPQQLKVFQLYYIENNGYSGIGRELNISRQRVEMLYKSIKLKLGKIDSVDLVNNLDTIDSIFQVKGIMI